MDEILITDLRGVAEDAARRLAAIDKVVQSDLDDWMASRESSATSMDELVSRAAAAVDETDPEPGSMVDRRMSVMRRAAACYLQGSSADREMLEREMRVSPSLGWVARRYLDHPPSNSREVSRLLATAAMASATEDTRDLLVRVGRILDEAERRGLATHAAVERVESLASASGVDFIRRLRNRDGDGW